MTPTAHEEHDKMAEMIHKMKIKVTEIARRLNSGSKLRSGMAIQWGTRGNVLLVCAALNAPLFVVGCRFDLPDAGVDTPDAVSAARCDVTKPFGPPMPLAGVNTTFDERWGWLSADQLTIYFVSNMTSAERDLFFAIRAHTTEAFSSAGSLGSVNTANTESRPTLTADGLTLYIETRSDADYNINVATRTSTAAIFTAHTPVAAIRPLMK